MTLHGNRSLPEIRFADEGIDQYRVLKFIRQNGRSRILQKGDAGTFSTIIPLESVLGRVEAIEKSGRVLALDKGRIKLLNTVLGIKNRFLYRFAEKMVFFKGRLKNKPGYYYFRAVYRLITASFTISKQKKIVDRITGSA